VPLPFAANGQKNVIPEASQISIDPGAASLNDGFPPLTMIPRASGGIPPSGLDFNGAFNLITQSIRWAHAGGSYAWNSAFALDSNVGGYPKGAVLSRADLTGFWLNTVENNATNPDATDGSAAGWVPGYNYGVTPITGLTNANVTLSPLQAAKNSITLAGALTGSINIVFPTWTKEWTVVNNTTGNFTITATTAGGTGVTLASGATKITGDGTNITLPAVSIAAGTLPTHAMQLGQAIGRLINIQRFPASGTYTPTAGTTSIIVEGVGGGAGGGGCPACDSSHYAASGGGASGTYARTRLTSGFAGGIAVTIGAAGNGGAAGANAGTSGGTTSFGSLVTFPGGNGSPAGVAVTSGTTLFSSAGSSGGNAIGSANLANVLGQGGGVGLAAQVGLFGGAGGSNELGGGTTQVGPGTTGISAAGWGGGGSGCAVAISGGALAGGAGSIGYLIVYEYA
jgi:hypothetical protein